MRNFSLYIAVALTLFCLPSIAFAGGGPTPGILLDNCAPGHESWHYTAKVVDCVGFAIEDAVYTLMGVLSDYMTDIVGYIFTLAVAFFGIRIMGGEPDLKGRAIGLLLRIGLVYLFYYNLAGISWVIYYTMDWMIYLVFGGSPWLVMDQFLGRLLGTGPPPMDISMGLLGLIGAALFSSTAAGVLFFVAISALINMLLFIFRVVFTYLTALTVIGFLIAISPVIIPMATFSNQQLQRFFDKWLDILISAMLVPVLLFAFLSVALYGFGFLINDIFYLLCGSACVADPSSTDFSAFWRMNEPKFAWMIPSDAGLSFQLQELTGQADIGSPAVQTNIAPMLRHAHDVATPTMPGIDFGPRNMQILQELIYTFLALWIFASFMKSMVDKIPDVAYNITEAYSYISMQPTDLERKVGGGLREVRNAVTGWR